MPDSARSPSLTILTSLPPGVRSLLDAFREYVARAAKKLFFALTKHKRFLPVGGPTAVLQSLLRGLDLLNETYRYNRKPHVGDTVCVLASPDALRYAIEQKKAGTIRSIIAGPNVVHNPGSENSLIQHPLIDRIIVPSSWTKDWWASQAPGLAARMRVWGAGVDVQIKASSLSGGAILFVKDEMSGMVDHISERLKVAGISVQVLRYGTFWRGEYLSALQNARFMIYLSHTESQGIALAEAWMADVPTFVWNPGFFEIGGFSWKDPRMSAPYLEPACGAFFKDLDEFDSGVARFLESKSEFSPRAYALEHFSDSQCARRYLEIAGELA